MGDTPYLDGKETKYKDKQAMSTLDVPTQTGVSAPLVIQAGARDDPGRVAQPSPLAASKSVPTPPQEKPSAARSRNRNLQPNPRRFRRRVENRGRAETGHGAKTDDDTKRHNGSDVPHRRPYLPNGEGGAPALASEPGGQAEKLWRGRHILSPRRVAFGRDRVQCGSESVRRV